MIDILAYLVAVTGKKGKRRLAFALGREGEIEIRRPSPLESDYDPFDA
jgi:hypothetical protein